MHRTFQLTVQKMTPRFIVLSRYSRAAPDSAVLTSQLDQILDEPETNPFDTEEYTSSDVEETCPIIQQLHWAREKTVTLK